MLAFRMLEAASQQGGATDPYWANVSMLLHFDGINGSTTFTDEKGNVQSAVGSVANIDTSTSVFGGASGYFDGIGGYVQYPPSPAFDFGLGDFTIEVWATFASNSATMLLVGNYLLTGSVATGCIFQYRNNNTLVLGYGDAQLISAPFTPTIGVQYLLTAERVGGVLKLFVNGVQIGSDTSNSTNLAVTTNPISIGVLTYSSLVQFYKGHLDDLRITKGIGRYTSNFSVPTQAFPNN